MPYQKNPIPFSSFCAPSKSCTQPSLKTILFLFAQSYSIFSYSALILTCLLTMRVSHSSIAFLLHALFLQAWVKADCECGYQVNDELYTDLLENDFLHTDKLIPTEWRPQNYTFKEEANLFGRYMMTDNVIPNPLSSKDTWSGTGKHGGDAGLRFLVSGGIPESGFVPSAEISSDRADMRYGSFRAGMKVTGVNGTCAAFFWVRW